MRRYTRWVLLLALITLAICVAARLLTGGAYRMVFKYDPAAETGAAPEIRTDSDIVRTRLVSAEPGRVVVDIIPVERGSVLISLSGPNGKTISSAYLTVDSFRTVYDEQTGSFNGDLTAMVSLTLFLLIVSAMMLHGYLSARGPALYNYSTVFYIGFFFFCRCYSTLCCGSCRGVLGLDEPQGIAYDFSIKNEIGQAIKASEEAMSFCEKNSVPENVSNLVGVTIEELCHNIAVYASSPSADTVDVCVRILEDEVSIRIRDNGCEFDPTDYIDDSGRKITGLELVRKISSGINYNRILGFNVTNVTVSY